MDSELKTTSSAGNLVLQRLLAKIKHYLIISNISLGELMLSPAKSRADAVAGLEQQIERAYLSLSKGQANVRVRVADLRDSLPSVPRSQFDETLLTMASNGKASLYRLDNPAEIRTEDHEAALRTPTGEERHLVYLGGRGS